MVITNYRTPNNLTKGKSKLISIKTDRIKLSVCVVYKESGNPMIVSVNTGDLDYSDMHITGSLSMTSLLLSSLLISANICHYVKEKISVIFCFNESQLVSHGTS